MHKQANQCTMRWQLRHSTPALEFLHHHWLMKNLPDLILNSDLLRKADIFTFYMF